MPNETTETTETIPNEATNTTIASTEASKETSGSTAATKVDEKSEEGKTYSSDYVKSLRNESATYRQKAKDLQTKAEEAEKRAIDLTDSLKVTQAESQKTLSETKRLNDVIEKRFINEALKNAALTEGLVDMDAFKMVDVSKIKVTDNGEVEGIKELIADLKKDKSYLFKEVNTSNKNVGAPPVDNKASEKPTYADVKELSSAKAKFLASLSD